MDDPSEDQASKFKAFLATGEQISAPTPPGTVVDHETRDQIKLPKYACTKQVWAAKILAIVLDKDLAVIENRETTGGAVLTIEGGCFEVDHAYMRKHNPYPGGYWVQYADGYESFSTAKAFEEGYEPIAE